jgi:excisionase family DNA binding protein
VLIRSLMKQERTVCTVPPDPPNMSIAQAADYAGVVPRTVRNMIKDGRLPAYRCGDRLIRLRRNEVEAAFTRYGSGVES